MSAQFPLFAAEPVWSVAALTHFVRELFDSNPQLQDVSVEGEVSNLTRSTAGHLYFTLRDAQAALNCVVWRADAQQLARQPINGDQVVAFGSVSVYEQTGRYQLYATSVQLAGLGERLRQLEELKRRLAAEGLFDAGRKRALPAMPRHIALVTSPRGAAVSDMRRVLARRWPLALVSLLPAVVQGDSAPAEIVAALQAANRKHPDVILLARGGGAIEDLWAFNDERVVRAIVASAAPVVTGVGHETDVTLADFAADVRAATPSVAAELATFTWDRQVVFLKSPHPKGANYFVIRDGVNGPGRAASWWNLNLPGREKHMRVAVEKVAVDTAWPTKLDLLFPGRRPAFEIKENRLPTDYADTHFRFTRPLADGQTISRDYVMDDAAGTPLRWEKWTGERKQNPAWWDHWISIAHNPATPSYFTYYAFAKQLGFKEQQVTLRLAAGPGEDVAWVLYPRGPGEAEPTATQLAPGVTKVVTGEGTDYVLLSAEPLEFKGEGIDFAGQAGAVRVPNSGDPELVLLRGSRLAFRGQVVEAKAGKPQVTAEHGTVRFQAPAAEYVNLTHGTVGVRGVGPFDLTFTADCITGTVDGDVRTLVCTWPERIVRPGYWMDGVRWCAGFADEHSIVKGTATPQFGIAFGVSAGRHEVRIAEWEWPAVPPPPARKQVPAAASR